MKAFTKHNVFFIGIGGIGANIVGELTAEAGLEAVGFVVSIVRIKF